LSHTRFGPKNWGTELLLAINRDYSILPLHFLTLAASSYSSGL